MIFCMSRNSLVCIQYTFLKSGKHLATVTWKASVIQLFRDSKCQTEILRIFANANEMVTSLNKYHDWVINA